MALPLKRLGQREPRTGIGEMETGAEGNGCDGTVVNLMVQNLLGHWPLGMLAGGYLGYINPGRKTLPLWVWNSPIGVVTGK